MNSIQYSMTWQEDKKKKVDNDKLNHMIVDVVTFLEAVKKQSHPCGWMKDSTHFVIGMATCHRILIFFLQRVHWMMYCLMWIPWKNPLISQKG
jgi:hypothetical protein